MEKWKGSFAKNQLEKFGWENGEGLGKNKDGRVKHITVTKKNDTKGVGVGQNQWEFAWWDHLYNKSASEVAVEKDNESESVKVAKKGKGLDGIRRSTTGIISTHRPTGKTVKTTTTTTTTTSMSQQADLINNDNENTVNDMVKNVQVSIAQRMASTALYSGFVKSTSGVYDPSTPSTPETATTDQSNDDDDGDDELKDYSIKVTDEELFKACEGRTARKGGRGLVEQKGKFARVMKEYLRNEDVEGSLSQKRKLDDDKNDKDDKSVKKAKKEKKEKKVKKEKKAKKDKKEKKEKKSDKKDDDSKEKKKKKKDDKEKKKKKKD